MMVGIKDSVGNNTTVTSLGNNYENERIWNTENSASLTTSSSSSPDEKLTGIVSDSALNFFFILNNVILTGAISTIGSVFNVINVIVFWRMGFKDTVNITLMSLAVADLGALLPLVWKAVCFNPYFHNWDKITFNYQDIQYFTAAWPKLCFARVSSLITAFVTFERCLCIAIPLKVRKIITPKRTIAIVISIFLFTIGSVAPVYFVNSLGPKYFPKQNETLIGLIYSKHRAMVENVSLSINICIQISSVAAVIICTIVLVVQLKQKSAWRAKSTGTKDSTSNVRDMKVVNMVLFISIIFIICFFPSAVNMIIWALYHSEYSIRGRYRNLYMLTWAIFNTSESTNSTVNIFVYIKMSTRYNTVFNDMFAPWIRLCRNGGKNGKDPVKELPNT